MAAHILTAIDEACNLPDKEAGGKWMKDCFKFALGHAALGDNLDSDDWIMLNTLMESNEYGAAWIVLTGYLRAKYSSIWGNLGMPRTAEEWQRAKYTK